MTRNRLPRLARCRPGSIRLHVEALEDRAVPATFKVTTFKDDEPIGTLRPPDDHKLSLREALHKANTNPGADTIQLKAGIYRMAPRREVDDYELKGGRFEVGGMVTIVGV